MVRRRLLLVLPTALLTVCAGWLSACGGPADTEVRDPAASPTSSSPTASPTATATETAAVQAPVELRPVLATDRVPAPDSQVRQQFQDLDCDAAPEPAAATDPIAACDRDGTKYSLQPAGVVGGVVSAEAQPPQGYGWVVALTFDAEATAELAALTAGLAQAGRELAVVLDGRVLTAATIEAEIDQGQLQVVSDLDEAAARELAARLAP